MTSPHGLPASSQRFAAVNGERPEASRDGDEGVVKWPIAVSSHGRDISAGVSFSSRMCVYACVHVYVCMCMCECICVRACTQTSTGMYTSM